MPPSRPKFTLGRMMIGVAILAPFLVALRDGVEGSVLAGAIIVVACVMILASKLTVDAIARNEVDGKRLGRWRRVRIVLVSSAVALAIIGTTDLAFAAVYFVHVKRHYYPPRTDVRYDLDIHSGGLIEGAIAAAVVVALARLLLWLVTMSPSERFRVKSIKSGLEGPTQDRPDDQTTGIDIDPER